MNYIGSKKSLLPFLEESILQIVGKSNFIFLDLFAGTGIVGQHFKNLGNRIISNDIQYYSYVLNKNYIANHKPLLFNNLSKELIDICNLAEERRASYVCQYLDSIPLVQGFIFDNYCIGGANHAEYKRQYFSDENGKKADAIRQKVEFWKQNNFINEDEYFFLLSTLIENIDKVANTASVYGAFLKQLKKSAQKVFIMNPANFIINDNEHIVFNDDIERIIEKVEGDVLYLDPPYNSRQYATNYHLLETIARYDSPIIKGKTGLREYSKQKSKFAQKSNAIQSLENVVLSAKVKYIFLSYNNEGIIPAGKIKEIMSLRGDYGVFTKEYSRFKADTDSNRNHKANSVTESLHYVVCTN